MFKPARMISGFTIFVNRILILALSVGMVVLAVDPNLAGVSGGEPAPLITAEKAERFRVMMAVLAAVLLALNLNIVQFFLYNIWNSESRRYIASKTASGTARVSLDAIQRSLMASANAMPEIARCRLEVYRIGHTRYKVSCLFWMLEGRSVINISEKLRLVLKKQFSDLVSISPQDRVDFDITLAGMLKQKKPAGGPQKGAAVQAPFQGPVYPVEGES